MRRRDVLKVLGGAATGWPFTARAQHSQPVRRIGVLMHTAADDPEGQIRLAAFIQGLQEAGWAIGRNVRIDTRWAAAGADRSRSYATELVALTPEVILASASSSIAALQRATSTIPVVFANVSDPVGAGYVASLARPGGNITGFTFVEYSMSGKWLELLKEIAPRVTRVAILRDPGLAVGIGQLGAIQSLAPTLGVETTPIDTRDPGEIERGITDVGRSPNAGLVVVAVPGAMVNRKLIITLAAQHRLPAVYFQSIFARDGGLISYGPDPVAVYRQAAGYVDRILKGEKPADLPVQAPNKYELVINLKTAKALGLTIPSTMLTRADAVIE
jgi:putative ABC transport system substrate-binding protein